MKKLIVIARNHMDPCWRRCFTEHFTYRGDIIHPYSDIEEAQIASAMDMAEKYGYVYSIEQAISVRRFLERNPDRREAFIRLLREGKLELLGGGETVIDYNMPCGESVYRTHYYSIKYYQREFGIRPEYADCIDTFGLSAQLPQIFSQFGYRALTCYSRVFTGARDFWRGLDGTLMLLSSPEASADFCYGDWYKYTPCPACHGEGCEKCGGSGIDYTYDFSYHERGEKIEGLLNHSRIPGNIDSIVASLAESGKDTVYLLTTSEETLLPADYPALLDAAAGKYGFELSFVTYAELIRRDWGERIDALISGRVAEEDIDPRPEGNPMACGCFTSRIHIKQRNRMLENLLLTAEKLSAFGLAPEDYPHRKFEYLWNKMSYIQFHDCITASHCDAGYAELMRTCREVYLGGSQLRDTAARALEAKISVSELEWLEPFVVFNPTGRVWSDFPVSAVLRSRAPFEGAEIFDCEGNRLKTVAFSATRMVTETAAEVSFIGSIPAMGHAVFYWRPASANVGEEAADFIENGAYRVTADTITAKATGTLLSGTPGTLTLSRDFGHPWGRLQPEANIIRLPFTEVSFKRFDGYSVMTRRGGYTEPDYHVDSVTYAQTVTLYDGVDGVFFHTTLNWNGRDCRIYFDIPTDGLETGGRAIYEIPYGTLARADVIESSNQLGIEDEWPAIDFFGVRDDTKDVNVTLYNRGTPGCRVKDGRMQNSLLRSPTVEEFACGGAVDHGVHEYDHLLRVGSGDFYAADPVATGKRFNTTTPSVAAEVKEGALPSVGSYIANRAENVLINAVKRSEDGALVLRMAETSGLHAEDFLPITVTEVDALEENPGRSTDSPVFRPFEIKTLKAEV